MLIRNLDDAVIEALRERAAANGASVEEEARRALAASVGISWPEALARLDAVRARIGRREGPTVLEILRQDRDRDNLE